MSATARLDALSQQHPEWTPWLAVVREVVIAIGGPRWGAGVPPAPDAPDGVPLLAHATLEPDVASLSELLGTLLARASAQGLPGMERARCRALPDREVANVFAAVLNADRAPVETLATAIGGRHDAFAALADLVPLPFLHAVARSWCGEGGGRLGWHEGYCPVCGAWPAFAEVRGVERSRHLRCGRCGTGWAMPLLSCAYCGNEDHEALGSLVAADERAKVAIEVCKRCNGYLKAYTTLQPTAAADVMAADLASVEFDLAAAARGYSRPAGTGHALHVTLAGEGRGHASPRPVQ